jgi:DNA polymerase elongation subunit (family B)
MRRVRPAAHDANNPSKQPMASQDERTTLVVDIETVGERWDDLPEKLRTYLLERESDESEREAVPQELALYPGTGRVITICVLDLERDKGAIFMEGDGAGNTEWQPWPRDTRFQTVRTTESKCLELFWNAVRPYRRIVTYNGRAFDGPFLMTRSAVHGVPPTRNLVGNRYDMSQNCDLLEALNYQGATRKFSLEYWCRAFGIETPKVTMEGKDVGEFYAAGRLDEIVDYCRADVVATAELYRRVERTLLSFLSRAR